MVTKNNKVITQKVSDKKKVNVKAKEIKEDKDEGKINNLSGAIDPLLVIMRVIGLSHRSNRALWKKQLHSAIVIFFVILSATYAFSNREEIKGTPLMLCIIDLLVMISIISLGIANLYVGGFSCPSTFEKCHSNSNIIDTILCIDACIFYNRARKTVIKLTTFMTLLHFTLISYDLYMKVQFYTLKSCYMYFLEYILTLINLYPAIYFMMHLYIIKNKLFILNKQLQSHYKLDLNDDFGGSEDPRLHDISFLEKFVFSCSQMLQISDEALKGQPSAIVNNLKEGYLLSCEQADLINYRFSYQNICSVQCKTLTVIRSIFTVLVYALYKDIQSQKEATACIVTNILYSSNEVLMVVAQLAMCDFVRWEAKKTSVYIDNILFMQKIDMFDSEQLKSWVQLTSRRCPLFTACGFFDLDVGLIYKIMGVIFTYIVIIVQIHMNGNGTE